MVDIDFLDGCITMLFLDIASFDPGKGKEKGKGTGNRIFLRETMTVDCAIYRLPLRIYWTLPLQNLVRIKRKRKQSLFTKNSDALRGCAICQK